jgi:hypothetical protein
MTKGNWRGNAFIKEELRKIAKGATVIQSRIKLGTSLNGGPLMVAQWLRYCATNRKVAGSIPDVVIGIFH